jgi:hypothetical protein
MDDLIVAAIRRRLKTKMTDLGGSSHSQLKPVDPFEVANDELRLGFALPASMKCVYAEIPAKG